MIFSKKNKTPEVSTSDVKFYAMKNRFSDNFCTPFPASNDAEAIYQIRLVINQKREPEIIAEDFGLYCVGAFCTDLGTFKYLYDENDHSAFPICLIEDCSTLRVMKVGGENE